VVKVASLYKIAAYFLGYAVCISTTPHASAKVSEDSLRAHIKVLASDAYEGREPGTEGEKKTIQYITRAWQKAGLVPAGIDESWLQPVPLVQYGQSQSKIIFSSSGRTLKFNADEVILTAKNDTYQNKSVPVVFGGYGFKANGDIISNVSGKIVLLITDKAAANKIPARSTSAAREALIKAGAEGIILVADGELGNWNAMRRLFQSGPVALEGAQERAGIEGAISSEFAVGMVTAAMQDWDKLRRQAKNAEFDTLPLGINAALDITTEIRRFESQNVIGKIPGKKPGSGSVLFLAHWDHLGICQPDSEVDRICNGAVDNASGIAVLTEVARVLAKSRYDRDIYFLATTAEEKGLLGAQYFADNPVTKLDEVVVALNIDTIGVAPAGGKVAIVGRGETDLDPFVERVAVTMKRKIQTSSDANSFLRRQDGWALSEKNVPALMVSSSFADLSLLEKFMAGDYHGPNDELSPSTDLSGAAEDADLHIALGKFFASVKKFKGNNTGG
jgi:Peptidase family M28